MSPGASPRQVIAGSPRAFLREFTDVQWNSCRCKSTKFLSLLFLFSPVFSCSHGEGGAAVVSACRGGELAGAWGCGQGTGAAGTQPPLWPGRAGTGAVAGAGVQVLPRRDQKMEGFSLYTLGLGSSGSSLPVGTWGLSSCDLLQEAGAVPARSLWQQGLQGLSGVGSRISCRQHSLTASPPPHRAQRPRKATASLSSPDPTSQGLLSFCLSLILPPSR